jgi:hypothetical protein
LTPYLLLIRYLGINTDIGMASDINSYVITRIADKRNTLKKGKGPGPQRPGKRRQEQKQPTLAPHALSSVRQGAQEKCKKRIYSVKRNVKKAVPPKTQVNFHPGNIGSGAIG